MSQFILTIGASVNTAAGNAPTLDILVNGTPVASSIGITALTGVGTDILLFTLDYTGNYPSSLSFRFNAGSGDPGDSVTIESVRINGQSINVAGDLTATMLAQGQSSTLTSTAAYDHLFGRVEVTPGDLGAATQTGTGGDETIHGTNDQDTIDAGGGNDRVYAYDEDDAINGGAGNDVLYGQDGNDIILGGTGDDRIFGNDGDDLLFGGDDNDTLLGEDGNDVLNGGAGNDILIGAAGNDILYGEDGDDRLLGVSGNNTLFGDDGNDTIVGGNGDDLMYGGNDNDTVNGGAGNDTMYGEDGDDFMSGGNGDDTIDGGDGNDLVYGGEGADDISGGNDNDALYGENGDDTINGGGGADTLVGGAGADTLNGGNVGDILHGHGLTSQQISAILRSNPNVVYSEDTGSFYQYVGTAENYATAYANAASTTLSGIAGHLATITSDMENTFVSGLLGGTSWVGGYDTGNNGTWVWTDGPEANIQFSDVSGTSTNSMYENWDSGQPQNNTEYWTVMYANGTWHDWPDTSTHRYVIEWEAGQFSDDNAADILNGGSGDDWLYGWGGNDDLTGGNGNDKLFGQDGDDTMDGGDDDDILIGAAGSDTLQGGDGNDILYASIVGTVGSQTVTDGGGGGPFTATLIDEAFGTDTGVFTYSDVTDPGNNHAAGTRNTSDGDTANGSLEVDIGRNGSTYGGAEGHWTTTLSYAADVTNTQITLSYRHTHANQNDNGEDSHVYVILNGTRYDQFGGNGYISEAFGIGGAFNSGWQQITIDLPDLTANTTYTLELGMIHTGSNRNNEDATVRFDDVTVDGTVDTLYFINETFDTDEGVFTYGDSLFGGGNATYASGAYNGGDGDNSAGSVQVTLGGINNTSIGAHSGGYSTTVDLASDTDNITLDFSYRMIRSGQYENNEDTFLYVEIDNVKYGINPNNYVETWETNGGDPDINTGWTTVTVDIGTLTAGSHTVEIGAYSEGKTTSSETLTLRLDDIQLSATAGIGGNDATSSGNDSTAANNLDGGDGDDILYGSAGDDYLYGGTGSDILYSDSEQEYTVADALAEISGLQYNSDTGSFYLYVSGAVQATTAFANAAAQNLNGVAGHIVHVTSALENTYIDTLTGTATTWMGAQDTAVEGEWRWVGGVNDGDLFWLGDWTGSLQGGYTYENWNGNEPNDYVGGEDYVEIQNGGGWNDNGGPNNNALTHGYVIEWEASEVFSFGATVLNGGAGADDLYGSAGADLFVFDDNGADTFSNPDTIFNFDANDGDTIDISDILDGLGVTSANISNFVDVSEANGVRIDTGGTGSFGGGTTVATFSGFTAVSDEATMLAEGNLVIY
ncbi:MAG: type I secretion C-terminal target domain-containing protein [Rhodospirillales bacterium]|nr:type I secretion C-terminal target domain-containing protein [Rhodospirillales bacterium]MCB9994901.1 type I secretion C-terminal target domain-containing protein [Rhodospirillales bacterium]